ncbi:hypothetical protein [Alistipes sp.]|uniref:hypothetical protein n=1 Tax=Alistipes sp. TaxID=1872444 RepID=UPI003AEF9187
MKQINRTAAAALAALTLLACSKEETANPASGTSGPQTPYTITATFAQPHDTRISMEDDGATAIALKWKRGDYMYVVNGSTTTETIYYFDATSISDDGKTALFAGSGYPAGATPAFAIHQGTVRFSEFKPTCFNPSALEFFWSSASELPDRYPLWAKYDPDTGKLAFKPLAAVLKLNVTLPAGVSGTLSQITIETADRSNTFYNYAYDFTSGSAVRVDNFLAYKLTFTGSSPITEGTPATFYLLLRPGTEPKGKSFVITLTVDGAAYTATVTGGALAAGKCYPLTLPAAKWTAVQ